MANFDKILVQLFTQEPFYAGLMLNMRRIADSSIPTAAVSYNKKSGRFQLIYNPEFIGGMKTSEALAIFKHEMMHIIFKHVTGRSAPVDEYGMQIWNYATDLAINSHLVKELPTFTVTKDGEVKEWQFVVPGQGTFAKYPAHMSAEWYLRKILEDPDIKKVSAPGAGGAGDMVGDHDGWSKEGDGDDDGSTLEKAELRRMLGEGQKRAQTQSWGSVPESIREQIKSIVEPRINWKSVLRYFIGGTQRADKYSSFKKYNRRYPYQQPGRRTNRTAHIAISIDQSGSVGDELLAKFFSELNALAKMATFTVVPFDSRVHEDKIFEWKKGSKRPWERVAHGGTDFNAPTQYVNNNTRVYDGHIILTDMGAPQPVRSAVPRLWITEKTYENLVPQVAGRETAVIIV